MGEVKSTGRLAAMLGGLGLVAGALLIDGSRHWLPTTLPSYQTTPEAGEARPAPHVPVPDARPGPPARRIAEDLIAPPPLDVAGIER
ncbi:MAG: thermonuclease family protein, partial [Mesorhizobium sp.]